MASKIKAGSVPIKPFVPPISLLPVRIFLETLKDEAGEDSFSMMPLFLEETKNQYKRNFTIHHSINGSFAIRKGDFKFIFCSGSGGWSFPQPSKKETLGLPKFQLYNLKEDPGEINNLYGQHQK